MKIDGKEIAQEILDNLKKQVEKLKKKNIYPKLAIIIAGDDSSSVAYINQKKINADLIGIQTLIKKFSASAKTSELLRTIQKFNNNNNIHGIIVQQPLPKNIDLRKIINTVDPMKDVDGFVPNSHFQVPIAMAVLKVLEKIYLNTPKIQTRFIEWLKNKKIAIIGKGEAGGKPVITMFQKMIIPFSIIDSQTNNPENITKRSDIIISAVGKNSILKPHMLTKNVALIGIGISRDKSAKLTGDYDQNEIKNIASFYTPTPGGIGPINVAMLLKNVVIAAEK